MIAHLRQALHACIPAPRLRYADEAGTPLVVEENGVTYPSAAIVSWSGTDGLEEMHVFFAMAWFDVGSWAWAHYIAEWGTKGIFAVSNVQRT